ncbi:hypothetical protein C0989_007784 [Termitomyces sp. Mn162]|nr:hypothetical protein C0989_007784 [Termitomyces sp. Mn162]
MMHSVGVLAVARGEEWSKGHGGKERANCRDITEEGPSTPKAAAGGVTRGLATALRGKGEGKGKGRA